MLTDGTTPPHTHTPRRGQRKPDAETRPFYQASIAFNMIAAMATAGFLGYYAAGSIDLKETHVRASYLRLCVDTEPRVCREREPPLTQHNTTQHPKLNSASWWAR